MFDLFRSFFYKLRKDVMFRVVTILGVVMSIGLPLFLLVIDVLMSIGTSPFELSHQFLTGENLFFNCSQPIMNFAITLPVMLISFVGLEFNQGCIRNKIISGHSKGKIYFSLFLFGLVLVLTMMTLYTVIATLLGSILTWSGFHVNEGGVIVFPSLAMGKFGWGYLLKYTILVYLAYITVVSITLFFTTLIRNIGLTIVLVLILLVGLYFVATMTRYIHMIGEEFTTECEYVIVEGEYVQQCTHIRDNPTNILYILNIIFNPFFAVTQTMNLESLLSESYLKISNGDFIINVLSNIGYSLAFTLGGFFIFRKSEVK